MTEKELLGNYKLVLGLEIHMQPKVAKKMFCGCDADIWKAEPNTHTCPVCLGLPGALPVPNKEAVEKTQLLGTSLHCKLNNNSRFDRKHYFYPDLPKGYQISQYKQPLCGEGYLDLESGKRAEIERIHLEEDAAKSFHEVGKTLVDYNKGGMALMELVTKPIFTNTTDAVDFCKRLQQIIKTLNVSEADMEKGHMRLEANISLRTEEMEKADELPKYKVEVKNINSFKFMEKAVLAEIVRQKEILDGGGVVVQENRGYNEKTGKTVAQRSKEEAHDYRYFPEPDIPPMEFTDLYLEDLKKQVSGVEFPFNTITHFVNDYKISKDLARDVVELGMTEKFITLLKGGFAPSTVATQLIKYPSYSLEQIEDLLKETTNKIVDTDILDEAISKVLAANPSAVADYKKGKESAMQFLIGMAMRETKGKASAPAINNLLVEKLA